MAKRLSSGDSALTGADERLAGIQRPPVLELYNSALAVVLDGHDPRAHVSDTHSASGEGMPDEALCIGGRGDDGIICTRCRSWGKGRSDELICHRKCIDETRACIFDVYGTYAT